MKAKKVKQIIISLILAASMAVGMSGCSGENVYKASSDTSGGTGFLNFGTGSVNPYDSDDDEVDDDSDEDEGLDGQDGNNDFGTDEQDLYDPDHWGFVNSGVLDENNNMHFGSSLLPKGYYLSSNDYEKIKMALTVDNDLQSDFQSMMFDKSGKYNYNVENMNNGGNYVEWGGSCYGMVMTSILANRDVSDGEDYGAKRFLNLIDTDSLSEAKNLNKNEASAINFYHYQQNLAPYKSANVKFMKMDSDGENGQIAALHRTAYTSQKLKMPFAIGFDWIYENELGNTPATDPIHSYEWDSSGHTVMGYGIEEVTTYWKKDTTLEATTTPDGKRINDLKPATKADVDAYEKGNTKSCSHEFDYRILVYDPNCNDLSEDHNIYIDTKDGWWCYPYYGIMSCDNKEFNPFNDKAGESFYNDNGMLLSVLANEKYINSIDYVTGNINSDYKTAYEESPATIFVSKGHKYQVNSTSGSIIEDNGIVSENTYGDDALVTCSSDDFMSGGNSDLSIYLPQGESRYQISSDDDLNFGFRVGNMFISSSASSGGKVSFKEDGSYEAEYDSSDADGTISVTADGDSPYGIDDCNTMNVSAPGAKEIKVSQSSGGVVIDGDDLSRLSVSGIIDDTQKAAPAATTGDSVLISTDASSSNIVVKADTNGDGKYDKTISKTKIPKKSKQKVTLKKKTLNIMRGKSASLKAKAKTKLSYVRVSGNKKITVSSKGKVKVSKKLKKGTYRVKVKVTAKASKKYKKASKKFTIKVKVK